MSADTAKLVEDDVRRIYKVDNHVGESMGSVRLLMLLCPRARELHGHQLVCAYGPAFTLQFVSSCVVHLYAAHIVKAIFCESPKVGWNGLRITMLP